MNAMKLKSPVGTLTLVSNGDDLVGLYLDTYQPPTAERGETPVLLRTAAQLEQYFSGTRSRFDLPLKPTGTPFQRAVWNALTQIPFGATCSYADIARRIGRPNAVRAVGAANGSNPIAVIIPCHRVIGADGSLTGYGGGLPRKKWLLAHERKGHGVTLGSDQGAS
jgi:methylated-DNA-[protein]-cysteine S-methyltransferase